MIRILKLRLNIVFWISRVRLCIFAYGEICSIYLIIEWEGYKSYIITVCMLFVLLNLYKND
jgi:hypothetical protein